MEEKVSGRRSAKVEMRKGEGDRKVGATQKEWERGRNVGVDGRR